MTFTIITVTFNSIKTIERTLDSILNQSFLNFEYIVVDGNSNDGTVEVLEAYEKQFKEKSISYSWISENDNGIYDAWNKGLHLAKGDWISFLGSDDYYLRDALSIYKTLLNENGNDYDWIYSNVLFVENINKKRLLDSTWTWDKFRRNTSITPAHVGSFHKKSFFKKYGIYDESYKIAGDYEILLRPKNKLKTLKSNETTAVMSGGGVSNSMIKEVFKETFRAKNKTGGVNLATCYYDYYFSIIKLRIKGLLKN
ncbi:glycosyltransferase family 2 protein [Winogradskyella sp. PG-2]|uniref:glycosyltransferase family 2 protein n=1 Tax=Winogradskyella sp. PG-2 TaxID=754409 RepID=UPI0004586D9E|nr:glycosyltransferase family 2 protein [Winogradskyella sp. PG-2]BAO75578.1 glycosyl transferase, family 2 [Winogradskyella sp. PG-2]